MQYCLIYTLCWWPFLRWPPPRQDWTSKTTFERPPHKQEQEEEQEYENRHLHTFSWMCVHACNWTLTAEMCAWDYALLWCSFIDKRVQGSNKWGLLLHLKNISVLVFMGWKHDVLRFTSYFTDISLAKIV